MIRGMRQFLKEPTSHRTPDGGDGFVTQLVKKYDAWAKFISATASPLMGESQDPETELTHVMIIRNPQGLETPEIDWKVIYDGHLYAILDVQPVTQRKFFIAIGMNDNGPLEDRIYDRPETPENPNDPENPQDEPPPKNSDFPFWGDA
jgi:hypothetical protein